MLIKIPDKFYIHTVVYNVKRKIERKFVFYQPEEGESLINSIYIWSQVPDIAQANKVQLPGNVPLAAVDAGKRNADARWQNWIYLRVKRPWSDRSKKQHKRRQQMREATV